MKMNINDTDEIIREKFNGWKFEGKKLGEKNFEKCEFYKCSLIDFIFDRCKFDECKFVDCMFSAVEFNNCEIMDITVVNSKMIGIDWTKARDVARVNFTNSILDMSNFGFLKLNKSKLLDT
jgi:uncharacterized protein YjbI with pentapeptide repeats